MYAQRVDCVQRHSLTSHVHEARRRGDAEEVGMLDGNTDSRRIIGCAIEVHRELARLPSLP